MWKSASRKNSWLVFALGGLTVGAAALFWQGVAAPRPAYAQVPDSGSQRNEMIRELQESNKKLAEIAGLLREIRDAQKGDKADGALKPNPGRS